MAFHQQRGSQPTKGGIAQIWRSNHNKLLLGRTKNHAMLQGLNPWLICQSSTLINIPSGLFTPAKFYMYFLIFDATNISRLSGVQKKIDQSKSFEQIRKFLIICYISLIKDLLKKSSGWKIFRWKTSREDILLHIPFQVFIYINTLLKIEKEKRINNFFRQKWLESLTIT